MQKLYIRSQLPVSPTKAWDVFESDAFRDRLAEQTGIRSKVLDLRVEDGVEIRRLEFTSGTDLPLSLIHI